MRSIEKEIQELCDLVRESTYKDFIKKVHVNDRIPRQGNFPAMVDFDFKMLSATIFNEEYIVGRVNIWDEDGNWVWDSEIKERVYFKKD
jgi:hypothetical protein